MCLTEAHTNLTRRISNETKRDVNHRISALDPLADASHYGRHRSWDIEGRTLKHCVGRSRGVAVRDAGARRTAIWARHHAARRVVRGSHARHAHEGGTLRRDRQVLRRLLFRLDTLGARRARGPHFHPLGARTVESATGTAKMRTVRKVLAVSRASRTSSISSGRIVSSMFMRVNSRCAHQCSDGEPTVGQPFATSQELPSPRAAITAVRLALTA